MGVPRLNSDPMTVEEFFAFTDRRPDDEKWELIDGEPILNATPSFLHQQIAGNVFEHLRMLARQQPRSWIAISGIGVRILDTKLPVPDILVRPKNAPRGNPTSRECDDMIVAFEVLSPSTADGDLRWKRIAYSTLPSLTHYVVIAQDAVDVVVFARETGFAERRLKTLEAALELPSLGIRLSLSDIYFETGLR